MRTPQIIQSVTAKPIFNTPRDKPHTRTQHIEVFVDSQLDVLHVFGRVAHVYHVEVRLEVAPRHVEDAIVFGVAIGLAHLQGHKGELLPQVAVVGPLHACDNVMVWCGVQRLKWGRGRVVESYVYKK